MEIRSDNTSVITSNDSGKKRRLVRRHLNYLIPSFKTVAQRNSFSGLHNVSFLKNFNSSMMDGYNFFSFLAMLHLLKWLLESEGPSIGLVGFSALTVTP